MVVSGFEGFRELRLLHAEADKKTAEKQDFRRQEQPHADLRGVELLRHFREMVLQVRVVPVSVTVVAVGGRSVMGCG
jgi:hypothetical protein